MQWNVLCVRFALLFLKEQTVRLRPIYAVTGMEDFSIWRPEVDGRLATEAV
jgi:hypothetical protein